MSSNQLEVHPEDPLAGFPTHPGTCLVRGRPEKLPAAELACLAARVLVDPASA
jgi:hypothetical protein